MTVSKSQLRAVVTSPVRCTQVTDTAGNPSESYNWTQMTRVRREWRHEFWSPVVDASELTFAEITKIETQVRSQLYP